MSNRKVFRFVFAFIRVISYLLIIYMIYSLLKNNTRFVCSWNEKFGITCPSCGATRATLYIVKGDILKAVAYNPIYTALIFPIIFIFILDDILYLILRMFKVTDKNSLFETLFEVDSCE